MYSFSESQAVAFVCKNSSHMRAQKPGPSFSASSAAFSPVSSVFWRAQFPVLPVPLPLPHPLHRSEAVLASIGVAAPSLRRGAGYCSQFTLKECEAIPHQRRKKIHCGRMALSFIQSSTFIARGGRGLLIHGTEELPPWTCRPQSPCKDGAAMDAPRGSPHCKDGAVMNDAAGTGVWNLVLQIPHVQLPSLEVVVEFPAERRHVPAPLRERGSQTRS